MDPIATGGKDGDDPDGPGRGGLAQEASNAAVAIIGAMRQNGNKDRIGRGRNVHLP